MNALIKTTTILQLIDHQSFQIKYDKTTDITELIIKADVLLDEPVAREIKKMLEELKPGKKHFLLVQSPGFFQVTQKVRKLGASKKFSSHLAAVGAYSSNASIILLADLYNKINKPAVVTKIFHVRESALEWLLLQMKEREEDR